LPEPNAYAVAGKSDADTDACDTNTDANTNANGDNHTTAAFADTDPIGDPASADTKAKANAVPTAYAVSEWVKS
jgi:hypothetical protein